MIFPHKKADRQLLFFYFYMLLSSCLFSRGIYMIYLTHKGLSVAQVGLYQMLVQLSIFLFEIPTGYISDKAGKIKSLQAGTALLVLHCFVIVWSHQPALLILSGILEGLGYTFLSGSDSALLYELLKQNGREGEYLKLNANLNAAKSLLTGATISLGAILLSHSWDSVYYTTAACLAVAWLCLSPLREPVPQKGPGAGGELGTLSRLKTVILYPHLAVFLLCVLGFSCFDGISGSYYTYNQIIFQRKEIPVSLIGLFFSAAYLASSAAYFLAARLSRVLSKTSIIRGTIALQGGLFVSLAFLQNKLAFAVISFLCCLLPEVVYILADSIIQDNIASEYRATLLSIVSMLRSLVSAVLYFALGGILDRTDVRGFMGFLAFVTFGALCCFWFILLYKNRKERS